MDVVHASYGGGLRLQERAWVTPDKDTTLYRITTPYRVRGPLLRFSSYGDCFVFELHELAWLAHGHAIVRRISYAQMRRCDAICTRLLYGDTWYTDRRAQRSPVCLNSQDRIQLPKNHIKNENRPPALSDCDTRVHTHVTAEASGERSVIVIGPVSHPVFEKHKTQKYA